MQAPRYATPVRYTTGIVASFILLAALAACGQKGPLFMPPVEKPADQQAGPAAPSPSVKGSMPPAVEPYSASQPSEMPGPTVAPTAPQPGAYKASPGASR